MEEIYDDGLKTHVMMSLHDRIDILVNDYCKEKTTQLYPKHYKTCHDKSKLLHYYKIIASYDYC